MTSEKCVRKEKNQNIQVFVRLRPLNQREKDIKSLGVVEVVNKREVIVRHSQQTTHTKRFTFDKAFGPEVKQVEVYQNVVSPLIEEVLAGYNCTVFAYGQTGTGKTHTMVGEHSGGNTTWQNDPLAGIIPRALSQLFDELRLTNTEYTVRVSYLELYNEELFDLLSTSEDNSKLRIYEDVTRKGSNIVNGLEEITVYDKNEVYKIMAQGQERKRVASTLMNAQSSRSHTVFTIVVHMKEYSPDGEELMKIGKLNLVDLAGSENISKAGSDNPAKRERARECVNINQSLLTLGRVITALVERHPHIPYRESKLTRILQESLGGRTKTSIIATISPGHKDLEETMSTLEYANRAKNIQNKPEVNQKMTKVAILKDYAEEIDRLKRDLHASREKNGVYLANETYMEITLKEEKQRKEIQELLLQKRAIEEERDKMESIFGELNSKLSVRETELMTTTTKLIQTKEQLNNTTNRLKSTEIACEEQKHLVNAHSETERVLSAQAQELLKTATVANTKLDALHQRIDVRKDIEQQNLEVTKVYREQSSQCRNNVEDAIGRYADEVIGTADQLQETSNNHFTENTKLQEENTQKIQQAIQSFTDAVVQAQANSERVALELDGQSKEQRTQLKHDAEASTNQLESLLQGLVQDLRNGTGRTRQEAASAEAQLREFLMDWYSDYNNRSLSLNEEHGKFVTSWRQSETERLSTALRQKDLRTENCNKRVQFLQTCLNEIAEERNLLEQRLTKEQKDLEIEKNETEVRLEKWVEEERRWFEERIARHVNEQKNIIDKLQMKMTEIENERRLLDEMFMKRISWHESQLEKSREEVQLESSCIEEFENGAGISAKLVEVFKKLFEDGTTELNTSARTVGEKTLQLASQVLNTTCTALEALEDNAESKTRDAAKNYREACDSSVAKTEDLLNRVADCHRNAFREVITDVEARTASTIQELSSIAETSSRLLENDTSHLENQKQVLQRLKESAEGLSEQVQEELQKQADVEHRYLLEEYRTYTPTGATPSRTPLRFPRALAATSPHQRILAKLRQARDLRTPKMEPAECIVIDDADESETSISSDVPPSAPSAIPLLKSTSETDIYTIRRQQTQGKENDVTVSAHKKMSKLTAPLSYKKPLAEKNSSSWQNTSSTS